MTAAAARARTAITYLVEAHVAAIQAAPAREPEPVEPVLEPEDDGEWTEAELRLMDGNR